MRRNPSFIAAVVTGGLVLAAATVLAGLGPGGRGDIERRSTSSTVEAHDAHHGAGDDDHDGAASRGDHAGGAGPGLRHRRRHRRQAGDPSTRRPLSGAAARRCRSRSRCWPTRSAARCCPGRTRSPARTRRTRSRRSSTPTCRSTPARCRSASSPVPPAAARRPRSASTSSAAIGTINIPITAQYNAIGLLGAAAQVLGLTTGQSPASTTQNGAINALRADQPLRDQRGPRRQHRERLQPRRDQRDGDPDGRDRRRRPGHGVRRHRGDRRQQHRQLPAVPRHHHAEGPAGRRLCARPPSAA